MGRKRRSRQREPFYLHLAYLRAGRAVKISQMTLLMEEVRDNIKRGLV